MTNFILLSLIFYISFVSSLKSDQLNVLKSNSTDNIQRLKSENDIICTSTSNIDGQTFSSLMSIKSDTGCQSITITKCQFTSILIPDQTQSNGQVSIIYIKNSDFSIENSKFETCSTKSPISLSIADHPELDSIFCHAIFIDENPNNAVSINNCDFLNNGNSDEISGTNIFSNKANKVEISFSEFKGDQISTRAYQSYDTSNILLSYNTFDRLTGSPGQNGGALLIQSATDVSISDCIFDSNALQPTADIEKVVGSAFYINLNDDLTFTNNTISNHKTYLNSVITFNKKSTTTDTERQIFIYESTFNNNEYTKSVDGSGFGFYAEDYGEKLGLSKSTSYFLHVSFSGCHFEGNGDSTTTANSDSAGVFGWSRETTKITFIDCQFESNNVPTSSSLINIQNGHFLEISDCVIEENINYCFLKFSPLTVSNENQNFPDIQIKLTNNTITNTDTTNRINYDFILIDKDTVLKSFLSIDDCTFSDISLNTKNFMIRGQSNLQSVQISNSKISSNDKSKGSNIMKFQTSEINYLSVNDCTFENSLYVLNSDVKIETVSFENCQINECKPSKWSDFLIITSSDHFTFKYSYILFSSNINTDCTKGIFIKNSKTVIIENSDFKNCFGDDTAGFSIRSEGQNITETSLTIDSCTFDYTIEQEVVRYYIFSTNHEFNLINSTLTAFSTKPIVRGIRLDYICKILIDQCKFIKCNIGAAEGGAIIYEPKDYDQDVDESIMIKNSEFSECLHRGAIIKATPYYGLPKFINTTFYKLEHDFNFIITMQTYSIKEGSEFLFQNVSFIDCHSESGKSNGGGGIGLWYYTSNSNEDTLSFIDCRFENIYYDPPGNENGGGAIGVSSPNCMNYHCQILNCFFKNCKVLKNFGGAIEIRTRKSIRIENCYLENSRIGADTSKDTNHKGGAINIEQSVNQHPLHLINVTINESVSNTGCTAINFVSENCSEFIVRDCNFINCKSRGIPQNQVNNIISCPENTTIFECSNTNFVFDEKINTNPRAIQVFAPSFSFDNCTFIRCGSKRVDFGGAFFYNGNSEKETISIQKCLFEECDSTNSGAFKIMLNSQCEPYLNNNSMIKIKSNYVAYIQYKSTHAKIYTKFENHRFIGNTNSLDDGGGAGIFVSNFIDSDHIYNIDLSFINCDFLNNYTPKNGGAFGIGSSDNHKLTELRFNNCNFNENSCGGSEGAGALWIRTSNNCIAVKCNFTLNSASKTSVAYGGAIYLSFTSEFVTFSISDCNFINNSCPFANSMGHAIYSTLLYGAISISHCNFIDNGYGINYKNSIIYTRSEIFIYNSLICFTDKEESFSRGIYVGASSKLTLTSCTITNCSIADESGGALFYTSIKNRVGTLSINDNTFINNTAGDSGSELYLKIVSKLSFTNCTFINEDSPFAIITVIYSDVSSYSTSFNDFVFINCNFHYKQIYTTVYDSEILKTDDISFYKSEFINCSEISLTFKNALNLDITECIFDGNTNNDYFASMINVQSATISNCVFRNNNLVPTNDTEFQHAIVLASNCTLLSIIDTIFDSHNILDEEDDYSNFYIIKSDSNVNLTNVLIYNSSSCKYAISFLPPIVTDDEYSENITYSSFYMKGCVIDNSGAVLIENITYQVTIIDSIFSNTTDGLIYNVEINESFENLTENIENETFENLTENIENETFVNLTENIETESFENLPENNETKSFENLTENIELVNNTFNGITNCACLLNIIDDIDLRNCTIMNCQGIEKNCPPLFEINIRNNEITQFSINSLTFINNNYNNLDVQRWMNGGGSGFAINYENSEELDKEIFLIFNDCRFISNVAESYGGAFAFTESTYSENKTTSITFENCYFKDNSCKENKGNSLYIENCIKEIVISKCHFVSDEIESIKSNEDFTKCSSIYIEGKTSVTNSLVINDLFIENTNGIYISPEALISEQISLENSIIDSCNYGIFYESSSSVLSTVSNAQILIKNCTFISVKNALYLSLISNKLALQNNTIVNCSNLDNIENKLSVIRIKICSTASLVFDHFCFKNNKYLQPKTSTTGFGGGIGLNIINSDNTKRTFNLEFNACEFYSNEATDGEPNHSENHYSGGVLYYTNDDKLSISSLSFSTCTFIDNYAVGKGGAIYIETGTNSLISIFNCSFILNRADNDAAAVFVKNRNNFNLESSQFINNTVSHSTPSSYFIPTDSLVVNSNADATISSCYFIRASYVNIGTNVQASFSIDQTNSKSITVLIKNSPFSSINPTKSMLSLRNIHKSSTIQIFNSSFTHFYLKSHISRDVELKHRKMQIKENNDNEEEEEDVQQNDFDPIFIFDDSVGKIIIDSSCFDTESMYTFDKTKVGFDTGSSTGQSSSQISTDSNSLKSLECYYPPIIDELIKEMFNATPTPNDPNTNFKYMLIGVIVGAVALIIIIVIIVVVVLVKKKKKRELEEQARLEAEKETEMSDENDSLANRFATQIMTQDNPLFTYANINIDNKDRNNDDDDEISDSLFEESK